jgi:uncharacterized membrane protein (UPF0127 family)
MTEEFPYMDQRRKILIAVFSVAFLALVFLQSLPGEKDSVDAKFYVNDSISTYATLEVADNQTERKKGLMNRTKLGKNRGMLFVFEEEAPRGFWMKNTLIPLDMIFLDKDKEVINIETAYPEPNTSDSELKVYRSERPAKYVIEVNAGFAENNSIRPGTEVSWK